MSKTIKIDDELYQELTKLKTELAYMAGHDVDYGDVIANLIEIQRLAKQTASMVTKSYERPHE